VIEAKIDRTFATWRDAARRLLSREVSPEQVIWSDSNGPLLPMAEPIEADRPAGPARRVPPAFVQLCEHVACHRDAARWSLMYRLLWRLTHGEPNLLDVAVDDDVHRAQAMEKAVRRDRHKMTAFVRFRQVIDDLGEHYVAWYQPDHFILRLTVPHFVDRFAAMRWAILTPDESAVWDGNSVQFTAGVPRRNAPADDELEALWKSYYASIFNPNRLKVGAMTKEMPRRFWPLLPEAELIAPLIGQATRRANKMTSAAQSAPPASAAPYVPPAISLAQLREAAAGCRGCDLYCRATQTVFGEGPGNARLVFVGEQPGDQEDLAGRPFVGPAGQVFDEALAEVGIRREETYVTNTVKHFKWEPRGKRRMHQTPSARDVAACSPWLEAELGLLKPPILVCLGATAAKALLGRGFSITRERGTPRETQWSPWTIATFHPSALLRIPDEAARARAREQFVADLALAAERFNRLNSPAEFD
jgi:DNA polymerase